MCLREREERERGGKMRIKKMAERECKIKPRESERKK